MLSLELPQVLLTSSPYKRIVATGVAAAIAVGGLGYGVSTGIIAGGSDPTTKNIWIDANGGTCVDNVSPVTYSDSTACSWDAANDTADNGDTIGIKGGTYGAIDLSGFNSRSAVAVATVVSGESVVLGGFEGGDIRDGVNSSCTAGVAQSSYLNITGPVTTPTLRTDCGTNWTLTDFHMDNNNGALTQPHHVEGTSGPYSLIDSTICCVMNANAMSYLGGSGPWLFDHVVWHDSLDNTAGVIHTECMYATTVSNITIRRSRFYGCATEDIFITGSEQATNWTIENTVFEHPLGPNSNSLAFRSGSAPSPSPDGFNLHYNTFGRESAIQLNNTDNPPTANGFSVIGNIFTEGGPCGLSNSTYSHNVFPTGGGCGTSPTTASTASIIAGFTNAHNATANDGSTPEAGGDYSLLTGSPAKNVGNTSIFPALDLLGTTRYKGSAPDPGAYEFQE